MGISIKTSDLQFKYRRKKATREEEKFQGKPDARPFDSDDLYEVIPMFEAVMNELKVNDGKLLNALEEIVNSIPAGYKPKREAIFDFLVDQLRGIAA